MKSDKKAAHIVTTKRKYKGKVYTAHLLRRSYRENGKVKNQTLANLSHLPIELIEVIRRSLKGESFVSVNKAFDEVSSWHHGHVKAVRTAMRRLGFAKLIDTKHSRQRDLVEAMVVCQILAPRRRSKLAYTRWWHTTTLPDELGVTDASEDELYFAMDWLLKRQKQIEMRLAGRHLDKAGMVLYDLTSSYFEGVTCPLAARGHNRDGKKGKMQVNYGLLADERGCPVAVSVYKGDTGDPTTLLPEVKKVKDTFGIDSMVLVGDRGMISQKQIDELGAIEGVDWITALRSGAIRKLISNGQLQLGLFDERNLFEFEDPNFPGERLVACRNPELKKSRNKRRRSLLEATIKELEKVLGMVANGKLQGASQIGVRVGKVINKYKVAKHFVLDIRDDSFGYRINEEKVTQEALLDGIYVIRTNIPVDRIGPEDTVRSYKRLSQVERAFQSMKTMDLHVRPIRHSLEDRVRAHIFLCMLSYYVVWYMLEAWRPLLFCDEEQEAKQIRDPVAPAKRSDSAMRKVNLKHLSDGSEVHSFQTLLDNLSCIVKNTCRPTGIYSRAAMVDIYTTPSAKQKQAFDLLNTITL